ncbi:uncharacterized protein [Ptychodera flava]|uniref:uncharacterized protein n=1 Tax=Ptychodera flava TaxID=63121 RepID=UPI003969CAD9
MAVGLRKKMSEDFFIQMTYSLMDILQPVMQLNLFFQKKDLDIGTVQSNIDAAVRVLKALRNDTAPTPGQPTFQDQLKEDLIDGLFRGHHVITKSRHIFSSTKNAYVDGLIDNIESRFPNQELMTSMCVLGMRPVSLLTDQDLADWGNDSIEVLISHFGVEQVHTYKDDQQVVQKVKAGSVINPQQTRNEWMSLKKVVKAHGYPRRSTAEFWGIYSSSIMKRIIPTYCI